MAECSAARSVVCWAALMEVMWVGQKDVWMVGYWAARSAVCSAAG